MEGWLPGGGWVLVIAKGKVGKSLLVTQILHALATGQAFWGGAPPEPMPCVLVQADTPPGIWQDELTQAGFPTTSPVHILFAPKGSLGEKDLSPILKALEPVRPCYVAFDALDTLFQAPYDVNDPNHIKVMLSRIETVAQSPAFCVIHHARKGHPGETEDVRDAAAGNRVLLNRADQVVYLRGNLGPIEITGRLFNSTYDQRHLRRLPGGQWEHKTPPPPP